VWGRSENLSTGWDENQQLARRFTENKEFCVPDKSLSQSGYEFKGLG
jgi:hypothetical protein